MGSNLHSSLVKSEGLTPNERNNGMSLVSAVLSALFFAFLLYYIAQKRGANKKFWFVMGLIFGVFALPFVFFARTDHSSALDGNDIDFPES